MKFAETEAFVHAVLGQSAGNATDARGSARWFIFQAAELPDQSNPLARFWLEDAPALDWRLDFLRDPATDQLVEGLEAPLRELEMHEEIYVKSETVRISSSEYEQASGSS